MLCVQGVDRRLEGQHQSSGSQKSASVSSQHLPDTESLRQQTPEEKAVVGLGASMASSRLALLLVSLTLVNITGTLGQSQPGEGRDQTDHHIDGVLQRAENIIIRSIMKKMEEDEENTPGLKASPAEWLSKRQHPGKRFLIDMEKRQHPGKREEPDDTPYLETQKRQHPGKRDEDEGDSYLELQKRQHPGRRSALEPDLDYPMSQLSYLNELSKRQHPGKRSPGYSKRQHPGKRSWEEESEDEEALDLEKRQHPGKRSILSR